MKFSAAIVGPAAETDVEISWLVVDGKPIVAKVRPLGVVEIAQSRTMARDWVKERKDTDARSLEEGEMIAKCVLAYVDIDSPENKREPFFGGGMKDLEGFHPLQIGYLFERQETWQSITSPYVHQMSTEEMFDLARKEVGANDDRNFTGMSPGMRWSSWHCMAVLLCSSPELRSHFIARLSSAESGTSTSSESAPEPPPTRPSETPPSNEPAPAPPVESKD